MEDPIKPPPAGAGPSIAGQARRTLAGALDARKDAAADLVQGLADTVRQSGERFEGQDWIAGAVRRGAAEIGTLAGSLRDRDLAELAEDVGAFARRRPALFAGAALAAGFAVARLGRLAAGRRDDFPTMLELNHGQR